MFSIDAQAKLGLIKDMARSRIFIENKLGFYLRMYKDLPDDWSCSHVPIDLCSEMDNTLLRHTCPVRCGCREARSPLFLTMPHMGCPVACVRSKEYLQALNRIPCSLTSAEQMQANVNWSEWLRGRQSYFQNWGFNFSEDFWRFGCQMVTDDTSLCHETWNSPGLGLWCPVECGCREPKWSGSWVAQVTCPSQCDAWGSRYEARLNHIPCVDGNASQFSTEEGASALSQHFDTFRRSFTDDLTERFASELAGQGCSFLSEEPGLCESPYLLKALCPVVCGCADEPDGYGCPQSCSS